MSDLATVYGQFTSDLFAVFCNQFLGNVLVEALRSNQMVDMLLLRRASMFQRATGSGSILTILLISAVYGVIECMFYPLYTIGLPYGPLTLSYTVDLRYWVYNLLWLKKTVV